MVLDCRSELFGFCNELAEQDEESKTNLIALDELSVKLLVKDKVSNGESWFHQRVHPLQV